TNGGADADEAHTYTVTNRTELVQALYPDAVIAEDGTFTSENGSDDTPKVIYVQGTINLSTNRANEELFAEDYACEGYSLEQYLIDYDPREWNKQPLVDNDPPEIEALPGSQEELRDCSSDAQEAVVALEVGSNTSLIGLGDDAKIIKGSIIVGGNGSSIVGGNGYSSDTPPELIVPVAENVIIRNITFEDAFDMFPGWEPDDSYSTPPDVADPESDYPLCQATYDEAADMGPHQCRGGRWNADFDNVRVQNAHHVWIDHCTFNDGDRSTHSIPSVWEFPYHEYRNRVQPHDALLDIVNYSDFVTVSYNVFTDHDKVMLIGGSDTVQKRNGWEALSVTLHHNMFSDIGQRTPRARFGKVHVYSNYSVGVLNRDIETPEQRGELRERYRLTSAINVGHLAKVYSENNVFELTAFPGDPEPEVGDAIRTNHRATPTEGDTPDVNESTYFFDSGSLFNGVEADFFETVQAHATSTDRPVVLTTESIWTPSDSYNYENEITPAAEVRAVVEANAGAGLLEVDAP
ncbi:MAG: hypothetical protein KTR25_17685, partial [Myxococcales bacterium]|nr:hypothetical protein [Myxococcales bacterium]